MIDPIERATLFALYQLSLAIGIVLLPVAVLAQRGGIVLPVGRVVKRVGEAYERTLA